MGNKPTNFEDFDQAMEGEDGSENTASTSSDGKNPEGNDSILNKAKAVLSKWGIPAAVVAAVIALAIYVIQAQINAGIVRTLKTRGADTVIRDNIRKRVSANALAYRILGLIANNMGDGKKGTGDSIKSHLQDPPAPPAPPATVTAEMNDRQAFLDALSTYVADKAEANGLNDAILVMIVEGKMNSDLDAEILKQIEQSIDETELRQVVAAIVTAVVQDDTIANPGLSQDTYDKEKPTVIRNAVEKVEFKRLLTAPKDNDETTSGDDVTTASNQGYVKGQPFSGIGASIKAELEKL